MLIRAELTSAWQWVRLKEAQPIFYATILIKVGWRIALRGLEVNIVGSIVGRLDVSQVEVSGVQDLGKAGLVIRLRVGVWLETVVRLQWQSVRSGALAW